MTINIKMLIVQRLILENWFIVTFNLYNWGSGLFSPGGWISETAKHNHRIIARGSVGWSVVFQAYVLQNATGPWRFISTIVLHEFALILFYKSYVQAMGLWRIETQRIWKKG